MAERRMFAKTIIDSDAFLDMPLTTQALYFHLSMRGDDEGFINNPKKIQRMIGATEDDLKLLVAKNFIIPFESGVVVIKHWKIHNYIRGDRLTETNYKEEKEMLIVKDNGAYTLNQDLNVIESLPATDKRKIAYEKSCLPYSFTYKMRRAFEGHICPICGCKMSSSSRLTIPTIQHNHPISKGGAHELENISIICGSCNASIQDTETGELNNREVIETWDKIVAAEKQGVQWFNEPKLLDLVDVSQMSVRCQSSDSQMSAQDRLGKDRLGKDRLGKDRLGKDRANSTLPPYEEIIKLYNSICVSLPRVQSISESRKKAIKARLNLYTIEDLEKAFRMAQDSDFLKGSNKRNWTANFDWLIKDANIAKVLDGNYSGGKRYDDTKPRQEDRTERTGLQEVYTSDDTRDISTEGVDVNQIFKELE